MIIMTIAFILMKHTVIKELMHDLIFLAGKSEILAKASYSLFDLL